MTSEGIDLDFGGADAITGFVPVPTGIYLCEITEATIEETSKKDGNHNVVTVSRVAEGPLKGRSLGKDWRFIPNRDTQTPDKFVQTAGFFKGWLEGLYDRELPDKGFRLNVKELPSMKFYAVVILEDTGFGPQNNIKTVLPKSADVSNVTIPQPTLRPQTNGGGTAVAGEASTGTFRI